MITRKQLKAKEKLLEKSDILQRDQNGKVIVDINVRDDSDFLSSYGEGENVAISGEVASFIDHSLKAIPPKENIKIVLRGNCISEDEQPVYEKSIKNYYENIFLDVKRDLKRNTIFSLLLALAGGIYFMFIWLLSLAIDVPILIEALTIAGWVFIWEAIDIFFLERPKLKALQYRAYQMIDAEIEFKRK